MKILHTVEFYVPALGGAEEVVRQLSEHLVKLGHDVTVATKKLPQRNFKTHNGVKIAEFDVSGNAVRGYNGEYERYKQYLVNSNFDVVMNYAALQWATDLAFEVIDKIRGKKVLVPCGYSYLYDPAYKNYFKKLPDTLRQYDATVYLSHTYRDIEFARKHNLENIHIIPNAADEKLFNKIDKSNASHFRQKYGIKNTLILTVGNHTGGKGHREALKAFAAAPIVNATFVIAGGGRAGDGCFDNCHKIADKINRYGRGLRKRVILHDGNHLETVEAQKTADIFLFLSNIEASPLVLFEATAAGTPFIASAAGNSAEIAQWTGSGLIVKGATDKQGHTHPSVKDAALKLTRLAINPRLRHKMGNQGRLNWKKRFTWKKVSQQYEQLYLELLK